MSTAPGWYADPSNPAQVRWWDGVAWSPHTQPLAAPAPATARLPNPQFAPVGSTAPVAPPPQYAFATPAAPAARGNRFSFITMGVVALYVVLAFTAHIVVFGILPVLMSVRAVRAKEPLGWVAVGCAAVAVLVALVGLSR